MPQGRPYREFESMEEICTYLLRHKEVLDRVKRSGLGGKAVFVMFDDETEAAAASSTRGVSSTSSSSIR